MVLKIVCVLFSSVEGVEDGVVMNRYSRKLTQVKSQGASQAMLYATGITKGDMTKAQVGRFANTARVSTCT